MTPTPTPRRLIELFLGYEMTEEEKQHDKEMQRQLDEEEQRIKRLRDQLEQERRNTPTYRWGSDCKYYPID